MCARQLLLVSMQNPKSSPQISIRDTSPVAFKLLLDSEDPHVARIIGVSIATGDSEHVITAEDSRFRDFFRNAPKVGWDVKKDLMVLSRHGIQVENLLIDVSIALWLLDPDNNKRSQPPQSLKSILNKALVLERELVEKGLTKVLREIEMPTMGVLADMELAGVAIDCEFLQGLSKQFEQRTREIESQIAVFAGCRINLNSSDQIRDLLKKLGLDKKVKHRTPKGKLSTATGDLQKLKGLHPAVELILEHRMLAKLYSTYTKPLPEMVHPVTGRVHTQFNQTGTATGRLASSSPNLQNIPVKTELGKKIREAFIAPPGFFLLSADYSQIELRVLAHMSRDYALINAFRNKEDVHKQTASRIFRIPPDKVTEEIRRIAKTINFGIVYGMTPAGLAERLGISVEEASRFISSYFAQYPRVRDYITRMSIESARNGYVQTLFGRRRYIKADEAKAERQAINTPIQGTAADIIKLAMINLHKELKQRGFHSRLILQVHDELVLEVPEEELRAVASMTEEIMMNVCTLAVPLEVEIVAGKNWGNMTTIT